RFVNPFIYLNPTSMFSINSFLYSAYILIGVVYLIIMFRNNEKWVGRIGLLAVIWAVLVHSGTGYIFGAVPRELYESPLLAPSFVAAALSSGTALIIILIQISFRLTGRYLDMELIRRLSRLLAVFVVVVFYFIAVENLFRAYIPKSREAEWFFLFGEHFHDVLKGNFSAFFSTGLAGSVHHLVFWFGLILTGIFIPAIILFHSRLKQSIKWINIASIMVVLGVLCERYIIVIPGQTHKPELVPGAKVIVESVDKLAQTVGGVAQYTISRGEIIQAVGIASIVVVAFLIGIKILNFLPTEARQSAQVPTNTQQESDADIQSDTTTDESGS
ncbi:MAG: polysulfide reductase NrfD, partial [Spirochaetota bacterium]|nr:polysulfide reductase NrfD [Spirochaetota bacterium]